MLPGLRYTLESVEIVKVNSWILYDSGNCSLMKKNFISIHKPPASIRFAPSRYR